MCASSRRVSSVCCEGATAEELSEAPVAPARPESSGLSMEDQMMAAQDAASPSREMDFEAMMGSEPAASSRRSAAERAAAQASLGVEETSPNPLADTEAAVLDAKARYLARKAAQKGQRTLPTMDDAGCYPERMHASLTVRAHCSNSPAAIWRGLDILDIVPASFV